MNRFSEVGEQEREEGTEFDSEQELYGEFEDLENEQQQNSKSKLQIDFKQISQSLNKQTSKTSNKEDQIQQNPLTTDEIERQRKKNLEDKSRLKEKFDTE
jgi:hypothetical protein